MVQLSLPRYSRRVEVESMGSAHGSLFSFHTPCMGLHGDDAMSDHVRERVGRSPLAFVCTGVGRYQQFHLYSANEP
jgi:hypothetical protein